jgi:hypothetical protein
VKGEADAEGLCALMTSQMFSSDCSRRSESAILSEAVSVRGKKSVGGMGVWECGSDTVFLGDAAKE